MGREPEATVLALDSREVRITHPNKSYFSRQVRLSKLDLVRYYLTIAPGVLAAIRDRPLVLKRFVNGAEGEPFYQKRAPERRPGWLRTATLAFPSGRTAEEVVVDDAAGLAWVVNLGCIELHPHPVRTADLDHPDELRIDLDPTPGVPWSDIRTVAMAVRAMQAGAMDVVEKPCEDAVLLEKIREALTKADDLKRFGAERQAVEPKIASLTPREVEVLDLMVSGRKNRKIAEELGISTKTLDIHRANILRKMQTKTVADLVRWRLLNLADPSGTMPVIVR